MGQKSVSQIINDLILKHKSAREFARIIGECSSDVIRWRQGKVKVKARAVVKLNRLFGIVPHDLRPDIFDKDLIFYFIEKTIERT